MMIVDRKKEERKNAIVRGKKFCIIFNEFMYDQGFFFMYIFSFVETLNIVEKKPDTVV